MREYRAAWHALIKTVTDMAGAALREIDREEIDCILAHLRDMPEKQRVRYIRSNIRNRSVEVLAAVTVCDAVDIGVSEDLCEVAYYAFLETTTNGLSRQLEPMRQFIRWATDRQLEMITPDRFIASRTLVHDGT